MSRGNKTEDLIDLIDCKIKIPLQFDGSGIGMLSLSGNKQRIVIF